VIFNSLPEDLAIVVGFLAYAHVDVQLARQAVGTLRTSAADATWMDQMAARAAHEREWEFKVQA
jgi:hypothetical protein